MQKDGLFVGRSLIGAITINRHGMIMMQLLHTLSRVV